MPEISKSLLKRHADEMAQEYASRVGLPALKIVGLIFSGLQLAMRFCTTRSADTVGKMRQGLRDARDNEGTVRPRLVVRIARQFQHSWQRGGQYLSHAVAIQMAQDALRREKNATDDEVMAAVGEAWEGEP